MRLCLDAARRKHTFYVSSESVARSADNLAARRPFESAAANFFFIDKRLFQWNATWQLITPDCGQGAHAVR